MKINGQLFKRDAAVMYKISETMEVAIITNIYLVNGRTVFFKGKCFKLSNYDKHFRVHFISPLQSPSTTLVPYHELPLYLPIHPRKLYSKD